MYFWVLHVATSKPKLKEFNLETVCITLFSIFLQSFLLTRGGTSYLPAADKKMKSQKD